MPNLAVLGMAEVFSADRAVVNVDYVLIGMASPLIGTWVGASVMTIALAVDLLVTFQPIWFFAAASIGFRELWPLLLVDWWLAILAVCVCAVVALLWRLALSASELAIRRQLPALGMVIAAVVVSDIWNGSSMASHAETVALRTNANPATSSVLGLFTAIRAARNRAGSGGGTGGPLMLDSSQFASYLLVRDLQRQGASMRPHILLVIVESWGVTTEPALSNALLAPFAASGVRDRYEVGYGTVPFVGATLPGELRELCGVRADTWELAMQVESRCLPDLFRRQGYKTAAFHGFQGSFYGRRDWYPRVGFDEVYFGSDIRRAGFAAQCGAIFRGICDAEAGRMVANRLSRDANQRLFVYWVTLQTHFPLSPVARDESKARQCHLILAKATSNLCDWFSGMSRTLAVVEEIARNPTMPPTRIVIVGDHSPPMTSSIDRKAFQAHRVPYLVLTPR